MLKILDEYFLISMYTTIWSNPHSCLSSLITAILLNNISHSTIYELMPHPLRLLSFSKHFT